MRLSETDKKVFEVYPVTEKEKNCRVEKCKRDWLRDELRKKIYEQTANSKREYTNQPEV